MCFPKEKSIGYNGLFTVPELITCPYRFTYYGSNKYNGIWDLECKKDDECPYYNSNKNYSNSRGKCVKGFCEFPLGIELTSFRYPLRKGDKPLCYNCQSEQWLPITGLDTCCDEQEKNKLKYNFLKSPDYAFKDDLDERLIHIKNSTY
jgi:hypothetical protein